jgi:hypothetical protein
MRFFAVHFWHPGSVGLVVAGIGARQLGICLKTTLIAFRMCTAVCTEYPASIFSLTSACTFVPINMRNFTSPSAGMTCFVQNIVVVFLARMLQCPNHIGLEPRLDELLHSDEGERVNCLIVQPGERLPCDSLASRLLTSLAFAIRTLRRIRASWPFPSRPSSR